jgi:AcrR family transcriptional regulator
MKRGPDATCLDGTYRSVRATIPFGVVPGTIRTMAALTKETYFDAALELLTDGGPGALTLAALCERVGATKGSFYHHFESLGQLQAATLAYWSTGARHRAEAEASIDPHRLADPHQRLSCLRQMAVATNHETEVAMRAWAAWYEPAAAAIREIEQRRRDVLVETFVDLGVDEAHAITLARVGTTLMAGVQNDVDKVDRSLLDEVLTEYQRWIEASLPT